jgi:hypothetical protein
VARICVKLFHTPPVPVESGYNWERAGNHRPWLQESVQHIPFYKSPFPQHRDTKSPGFRWTVTQKPQAAAALPWTGRASL